MSAAEIALLAGLGLFAGIFGSASHLFLGDILILPAIIVAALVIPGARSARDYRRKKGGRVLACLLAVALVLAGLHLLTTAPGVF